MDLGGLELAPSGTRTGRFALMRTAFGACYSRISENGVRIGNVIWSFRRKGLPARAGGRG